MSGEQWGLNNIEGYAATADRYDGVGDFTALAVVDGDAMQRLDDAIDNFADVADANMAEIAPQIARARSKSLEFVSALLGEEEGAGFSVVDLGDFLRQIKDVPDEVLVARDAVFAAIDAAVLHQVTRKATEQATGLNVFFPETPQMARGYLAQNIAPAGWAKFVESYSQYAEDTGPSNDANFTSDQADVIEIGPGGIRISGQLESGDEENVASTETQVYTQLDGRDALAVVLPAYLNSGGVGQVQGVWNYAVTTLQAGKKRAPASAIYQAQSGGLLGWFQALYTAPTAARATSRSTSCSRARATSRASRSRTSPTAARPASTSRTAARSRRTSSSRRAAGSSSSSPASPSRSTTSSRSPTRRWRRARRSTSGSASRTSPATSAPPSRPRRSDDPTPATTQTAPSRSTSQGERR